MATVVWLGTAVNVPHTYSFDIGGTWAAGDTITLTINSKSLTLTVGTGQTDLDEIINDLVDMVNGDALNGTETRSAIGSQVGEWSQITATNDGVDTVTLTGKADGQPFTVTQAKSSAAGTFPTPIAVTQTGSGGSSVNNTANWSGGALPSSSDVIVFDHRAAASMLYDLDQLSAVEPAAIVIDKGFQYAIGLQDVNRDDSNYPYDEYRETYFKVASGGTGPCKITINAPSSSRIKINTQDCTTNLLIEASGGRQVANIPTILWKGTDSSNVVTVNKGDLGIAFGEDESATVATLNMNWESAKDADAVVTCGDGCALTTVNKAGGKLITRSAITTLTHSAGQHWFREGRGTAATLGTAKIYGGTLYYESTGAISTKVTVVGPGSLDMRNDNRSRTFAAVELHTGAAYYDPEGTVTASSGFDFYECAPQDCTFQQVKHRTWTPTSI